MRGKERTEFGQRLATARKSAGLSQPQLAQKAGVSPSTIGEGETTAIGSKHTAKLAAVLGVRAEWLATGEGPMKDASVWPFSSDLQDQIAKLSPKALGHLEDVLRATLSALTADVTEVIEATSQVQTSPSARGTNEPLVRTYRPFNSEADLRGKSASRKSGAVPKSRGGRRA